MANGLFDPDFTPRGQFDPEVDKRGVFDPDLMTSASTSTPGEIDAGWFGAQTVRAAAASLVMALAVTTFGYADELPSVPVPDDDSYSVAFQKVVTPPLQASTPAFGWTAFDELPSSIIQAALDDDAEWIAQYARGQVKAFTSVGDDELPTRVDEDYQHPLVSLRAQPQAVVVLWGDDDLPRITTFEDDAAPSLSSSRAPVQVSPWTSDDDLAVASVLAVEEEYWHQPSVLKPAPLVARWDDVDEVPVLVSTDGEWTPLLDQRIDRPANLTFWTQPDEWPTPVPSSAVPTETDWTPLLSDRVQAPLDLRLWTFADELPTATVPDDSTWTLPGVAQRAKVSWLVETTDDLPTAVAISSLQERDFTPLLDQRIEKWSVAQRISWNIPDDLPIAISISLGDVHHTAARPLNPREYVAGSITETQRAMSLEEINAIERLP